MDIVDRARLGEENKERLRALYEGVIAGKKFNRSEIFHEDIVVYEPALTPWGGIYRGFEGQDRLGQAQKGYMIGDKLEILDLYADGPHVVSKINVTMQGSGKTLMLSEHVTYRDGRAIEMRVFVFDDMDAPAAELFASAD
jgi:hypothetical protein